MTFRRLKVIADTKSPEFMRVVDVESGDDVFGVTAIRWAARIGDDSPSVTITFAADMIDFEVTGPTKAEKD